MTFGERLHEIRKQNGITQQELADRIGVTKGTVSTWERNNRSPSFDMMNTLCDLFAVDLGYLSGATDSPQPLVTAQQLEDGALVQVEEYLTEYALKYSRLDQFGRNAVEALIRAEFERCKVQDTLCDATAYKGCITIRKG